MLRCPAVLFATLIAFSIHTSVADESDSARVISPAHQLRVTDTDVTSLHAAEGEYCFAGTRVGEIVVFRFADGRFTELKRWRAHTEAINDITYRNGIVFTASNDGYLKAWDLDTGERQWQTREHKNIDFTCVAYDSKRSIIWTGDSGGELRGYEAGSGESVASRKVHENMIFGLSYHREPDVLISLGHEGAIKMLKAPALESVGEATVSDDTAYAIDYDARTNLVAVACRSGNLRLFNLLTGEPELVLGKHDMIVRDVAFCGPDTVATAGWDKKVMIWNIKDRSRKAVLVGHHGRIHRLDWSEELKMLFSSGAYGRVFVWQGFVE